MTNTNPLDDILESATHLAVVALDRASGPRPPEVIDAAEILLRQIKADPACRRLLAEYPDDGRGPCLAKTPRAERKMPRARKLAGQRPAVIDPFDE